MDTAPGEGDIAGASEAHAGAVPWGMAAEGVTAHIDEVRILNEQIPVLTGVNRVAAQGDAVAAGKVHVVFLATDDVAADGKEAGWLGLIGRFLDADVRALGRAGGLDSVGGNGHFIHASTFGGGVDVNFGGRLRLGLVRFMVVVLDVVASDLQVAHLRSVEPDAAQPVVADVAASNVDLVQVHSIEIHPHAGIKIDVAMTDEYVAIALNEMNAMPTARDQYAFQYGLHGLDQFESISLCVRALHLDIADGW